MRAHEARSIARRWLSKRIAPLPGFRGALWHGSVLELPDDAEMDATSDIDVMVIFDEPNPPITSGKVLVDGVLLDVSMLTRQSIGDAERLLAHHNLAPSFRSPEILADPTGALTDLRDSVNADFAKRAWVERRSESVIGRLRHNFASIHPEAPLAQNVMAWLFGTGLTTHVLLVAGLRNPTVRKRYIASREMLRDYAYSAGLHEDLLGLLGSRSMTPEMVSRHVDTLEPAFDAASEAIRTPVFFASDLSPDSRPIAIGGSREMIAAGDHREAMFWIAATWARCMLILHTDAPELEARFLPDYREVTTTLGITSVMDMQQRAAEVEAFLPRLREIAAALMDSTPQIEG